MHHALELQASCQRLRAAAPLRPLRRRSCRAAAPAAALPPAASLQLLSSPFDRIDSDLSALTRQMDADMDAAFSRMDR